MTRSEVAALVVRMAVENPQWGYTRIRDALSNLGHTIARTTVKRILRDHGIDPAPERSPTHALEDVPTGALGRLGGLRSVHGRGADAGRAQAVSCLLRDRAADPPRDHRRDPSATGRRVDGAAGPQSDRPGRWLPADCAASDSRPRSPLHSCLWRDPDERRRSADPTSAEESQSQCLCRAVRPRRSRRSVSIESSHSARVICASSSTSTSSITIARETIRDSTTSSCNDRHLREGRTPTFGGGRASVDCSASTIERPHEWSAD